MNLVSEYPRTQDAPQSALQSLLRPTRAQEARMVALDQQRAQRIAQVAQAAELRHEARGRLARRRFAVGVVDHAVYRGEVTAADEALAAEKRDVPPAGNREALIEHGYAVAAEAFVSDLDRALDAWERQAAAWAPAAVGQAAGAGVSDE